MDTFWSLREVTSCRKSESALRSGQCMPWLSKKGSTSSLGPWYTSLPAMTQMRLAHTQQLHCKHVQQSVSATEVFDTFFAHFMVAFHAKKK